MLLRNLTKRANRLLIKAQKSSFLTVSGNKYFYSALIRKMNSCSASSFKLIALKSNQLGSIPFRYFSSDFPQHQQVRMPSLSPTMETGKIQKWFKKEGDQITQGDVLCDVVTDKATVAFEYQDEGYLAKILKPDGTQGIKVGDMVAVVVSDQGMVDKFKEYKLEGGQTSSQSQPKPNQQAKPTEQAASQQTQTPTSSTASTATDSSRKFASPLARATAAEKGIDVNQINGTGPKGRVINADVLEFKKPQAAAAPIASPILDAEFQDIQLSNVRKVIAERLTASKQQIPHYYVSVDCNMDNLLKQVHIILNHPAYRLRAKLNKIANVKLSVNILLIKAASLAAKAVPATNSSWMGTFIRQYEDVDMSVAVQTDNGLITPIVKQANLKGLQEIAHDMKDLITKAKQNKLKPHEFVGGTFTLSNLGMFGVNHFTAIINPPQACILAVSSTFPKVVVDSQKLANGEEHPYKVANMMTVTLSSDHRVVDGAIAAQWGKNFKSLIENPQSMLL